MNIKFGKMANKILIEIPSTLLTQAIDVLLVEYETKHEDILNTREKRNHALFVLEKIKKNKKLDFVENNIKAATNLNEYYGENIISDLPQLQKKFKCFECGVREFQHNAALISHQRTCKKKLMEVENQLNRKNELKAQGYKKIKINGDDEYIPVTKNLKFQIIQQQND